jgi:hypothetical protein
VQRLRQCHSDNSVVELTLKEHSWRVRLSIPREDGSERNLLGLQAGTLDEAKHLSAEALAKENRKHTCSAACGAWHEILT